MAYLYLILSSACSVAASVALKAAGARLPASVQPLPLKSLLVNQGLPYLYVAAIGAYGVGFGLYALALRRLDLTLAYPLMVACSVAGVFIYGLLAGTESISALRLAGASCIAAGVFLISK